MSDLTFTHRFQSGRCLVLTVKRTKGQAPVVTSSIQCSELRPAELAEYVPWRNNVVAHMMSTLTPEEVFAVNSRGRKTT